MSDLALELGAAALRVAYLFFTCVGAVAAGALLAVLTAIVVARRGAGGAKIKRIPGVVGVTFAYDHFTRAFVVGFGMWCWRFHWLRIGTCVTPGCAHGPARHSAKAAGDKIITWCVDCACQHYSPEKAA